MAARHTLCHFLPKHFDVLVTRHKKHNVILHHCMVSQILSYYADLIVCAWSWWYWYNNHKQSITSGMWGQTSQSNSGSDSPYFLLVPITTSFVAVKAILVFSIHDVTQKQKSGKSDIMFGIPAPYNHLFWQLCMLHVWSKLPAW